MQFRFRSRQAIEQGYIHFTARIEDAKQRGNEIDEREYGHYRSQLEAYAVKVLPMEELLAFQEQKKVILEGAARYK